MAFALAWLAWLWAPPAVAHEREDEALPPAPVRMRVIAPSAKGPWLLRIDNEGEAPVRIAADVRLLSFRVYTPVTKRGKAAGWERRSTLCDGPKAFGLSDHFPIDRELVLEPGASYVEEFDPRLICFGKDAELIVPGARLEPMIGWPPNKRRGMSTAPFVADTAERPRKFRPLRRLEGPTMLLSHAPPVVYGPAADDTAKSNAAPAGAPSERSGVSAPQSSSQQPKGAAGPGAESSGDSGAPSAPEPRSAEEASDYRPRPVAPRRRTPPRPDDELAARMTLTTSGYADATHPTGISVSVQAHNVGQRPLFVALRPRMLSFVVDGPDGPVQCAHRGESHKVPRDLFRTLHHGNHVHMDVMLAEMCPPGTFDRPGLYRVTPTLHAQAEGREYGLSAATGTITTAHPGDPSGTHKKGDDAVLVRMRRGERPFYQTPPKALPTRILP